MNWVNDYLENACYVDGGRGPVDFDCWGLVREVRSRHMGLKQLPSYGDLRNDSARDFTRAYRAEAAKLRSCGPENGAIAAVMVGAICTHVAVVLNTSDGLKILEINPEKGPRMLRLNDWLSTHVKVVYYND